MLVGWVSEWVLFNVYLWDYLYDNKDWVIVVVSSFFVSFEMVCEG